MGYMDRKAVSKASEEIRRKSLRCSPVFLNKMPPPMMSRSRKHRITAVRAAFFCFAITGSFP